MYSALQQQCLQQLGICLYQLKPEMEKSSEVTSAELELGWEKVAKQTLIDLQVMFPDLQVSGAQLRLNPNFTWILSGQEQIKLGSTGFQTQRPDLLSASEKKQIWQQLAQLSNEISN